MVLKINLSLKTPLVITYILKYAYRKICFEEMAFKMVKKFFFELPLPLEFLLFDIAVNNACI